MAKNIPANDTPDELFSVSDEPTIRSVTGSSQFSPGKFEKKITTAHNYDKLLNAGYRRWTRTIGGTSRADLCSIIYRAPREGHNIYCSVCNLLAIFPVAGRHFSVWLSVANSRIRFNYNWILSFRIALRTPDFLGTWSGRFDHITIYVSGEYKPWIHKPNRRRNVVPVTGK